MKVSYKQILKSFIENYVKVPFHIKASTIGFETSNSLYDTHGKYTVSKNSNSITHWYCNDGGKDFTEYNIEKDGKGNINITSGIEGVNKKILMKFSCKTEPLTI